MRTKGPRLGNAARGIAVGFVFGREDLVRRRAVLHPVLERGSHRIAEAVGSRTASAMLHAGDHVEASETLGMLVAHLRGHAFVIVNGASWRNACVAPAVEKNQLSGAALEAFQIGVDSVEPLPQCIIDNLDIVIEIKRSIVPPAGFWKSRYLPPCTANP